MVFNPKESTNKLNLKLNYDMFRSLPKVKGDFMVVLIIAITLIN